MRILIIRFSALGDVAMTVPVVYSLANQYPSLSILMLSKSFLSPLFDYMPANVSFIGVDLRQYKGLRGLYRLYKMLKKEHIDAIADFHDVLRSIVIRFFFKMTGVKVAHIDKGRREKQVLVRKKKKIRVPLKSSFQRYADTLYNIGFPVKIHFQSIYGNSKGDPHLFASLTGAKAGKRWIGIAPFAAHQGKILPEQTIQKLIEKLSASEQNQLFFFGGGEKEIAKLNEMSVGHDCVTVVAGKLKMKAELALMSYMDIFVSMDSANMHLASLVGVPVISVWGATHPYAGFMGWKQSAENVVQVDLPCRPCSIYGNRRCMRNDYACLHGVTADMISDKIEAVITNESSH